MCKRNGIHQLSMKCLVVSAVQVRFLKQIEELSVHKNIEWPVVVRLEYLVKFMDDVPKFSMSSKRISSSYFLLFISFAFCKYAPAFAKIWI